ncbi:23S rRNA (guanosine(2251)-2'-O)-methyltransferase RlmB [Gammaproteobacteria bacterium 45_16_T64]|nr:23S rRNA (guanosine(2251)-2'-O)-methyltransferase RlmB [Gammaproteobacteria bacterium 45_16_T64]
MAKPEWLYGIHTVQGILEKFPERVLELRIQQGRDDQRVQTLLELATIHGVSCTEGTRQQMDDHSSGANHQGVMARCKLSQPQHENELYRLVDEKQGPVLLLILDSVTDPHNVGACLRCADASGADAVITTKDKASGLTPVVRRVAVGAAETVPFIQVTNLARSLDKLKELGVWVTGTAIDQGAVSLFDADLTGSRAIVLGAEGKGLRRLTQDKCDQLVYIPMQGSVDSLNVSVAAGVCLFEALRQRG